MFCYQKNFSLPTEVMTREQFWALVRAPQTARLVSEAREARANGDTKLYDRRKKGLPLVIFVGTFDESEKEIENKKTGTKRTVKGRWRVQKHVCLNGLVVAESKDDMKKRGLKSPNLADALNTTFYQDYEIFRETYSRPAESESVRRKKKKKPVRSWKSR